MRRLRNCVFRAERVCAAFVILFFTSRTRQRRTNRAQAFAGRKPADSLLICLCRCAAFAILFFTSRTRQRRTNRAQAFAWWKPADSHEPNHPLWASARQFSFDLFPATFVCNFVLNGGPFASVVLHWSQFCPEGPSLFEDMESFCLSTKGFVLAPDFCPGESCRRQEMHIHRAKPCAK